MTKQWASKEVARAHGYLDMTQAYCPHHTYFSEWMKKQTAFSKTVVDIGCCSGRVLDSIGGVADKYLGVDFCEASIEFANKNRATDAYKFVCLDAENSPMPFDPGDYSICYIDSVLTMVQSPTRLLLKLAPYFDCIFLNRTTAGTETNKGGMVWAGMTSESVVWSFSVDYFRAMANETGFRMVEIIQDQQIVVLNQKG